MKYLELSRYLLTNKNKNNEILPLHLLYAGEIQKRTCGASITCWESTLWIPNETVVESANICVCMCMYIYNWFSIQLYKQYACSFRPRTLLFWRDLPACWHHMFLCLPCWGALFTHIRRRCWEDCRDRSRSFAMLMLKHKNLHGDSSLSAACTSTLNRS